MLEGVRIGIIGDFNPKSPTHLATCEALNHAADLHSVHVRADWVSTETIVEVGAGKALAKFDGLWCAPGSPYKSKEGALQAIRFARKEDRPFLGT